MKMIATIGLDIAKLVFKVHGTDKSGRGEVASFFFRDSI